MVHPSIHLCFVDAQGKLWQCHLPVSGAITVAEALAQSHFSPHGISIGQLGFGVFGRKVSMDTLLQPGERLEICRPLTVDPMQSRKRRANLRKAGILKKKHLKPDRSKVVPYDDHALRSIADD